MADATAKVRPILFSGEMIRALLAGQKTMTRRVVKLNKSGRVQRAGKQWHIDDPDAVSACPYGTPGDRLWVKETIDLVGIGEMGRILSAYAADGAYTEADGWPWQRNVLSSIHCPRGLSRITLEITDVRVERAQEITAEGAIAEGVPSRGIDRNGPCIASALMYLDDFAKLWNSINDKRGFGWDANPWVWVVSFRRVEG